MTALTSSFDIMLIVTLLPRYPFDVEYVRMCHENVKGDENVHPPFPNLEAFSEATNSTECSEIKDT